MISQPTKARGRPPQFVIGEDGNPVVGLSRHKSTDRYYATFTKPRVYFGTDFREAVRRFRAWQVKGEKVTIEMPLGDSPMGEALSKKFGQRVNIHSNAVWEVKVPLAPYYDHIREALSSPVGRKQLAEGTGIKELEYLSDLERPKRPAKAPTLEEIGELYFNKRPSVSKDELKACRLAWKRFHAIVGVNSADELTLDHIDRYSQNIYEIQEQQGHKPSFVRRAFSRTTTIMRWWDRKRKHPELSAKIIDTLSILEKPTAGENLPTPISKADLQALLRIADAEQTAMILLGLNCGFYGVDVRRLKKNGENGLDLERGVYAGYRHKTRIPQCSVLWKRTIKSVEKHLKENPNDSDHIFVHSQGEPYGHDAFRKRFVEARKKAGVREKVKFDNLRDGTASHCASNLKTQNTLLGHRNPGVADRYALRHPDDTALACRAIEAFYFATEEWTKK